MHRKLFSLTIVTTLLSLSSLAAADPTDDRAMPAQDYSYDFPDDPLTALSNGATGAAIRVRQSVVRRTLLRPRLHFVPEMLKSVENI